jgi:hypothetical protein
VVILRLKVEVEGYEAVGLRDCSVDDILMRNGTPQEVVEKDMHSTNICWKNVP